MTTRTPQRTHLSPVKSLARHDAPNTDATPLESALATLPSYNEVSVRVAALSCIDMTGRLSICETLKTAANTEAPSWVTSFKGNLDNPSTFLWAPVGWNSMSYVYADKINAQRCSRAAARVGIPCFGPRIVVGPLSR